MKFLLIMNNKMNMSGAGAIMDVGRFDDFSNLPGTINKKVFIFLFLKVYHT